MHYLSLLILYFTGLFFIDNPGSANVAGDEDVYIHFTCKITQCNGPAEVDLYEFDGVSFAKLYDGDSTEENTFVFSIPKSNPKYYYVGSPKTQLAPIILGSEDDVRLEGNCKNLRNGKFVNSPINVEYLALKKELQALQQKSTQAARAFMAARNDEEKQEAARKEMADLDQKKLHLLDSLKTHRPYLAKIAALNTYLSFPNHGEGYATEIEYFANEFFKHADLKDPAYNGCAYLYEAFRSYTQTLTQLKLPKEKHEAFIKMNLSKIPAKSHAYRYALAGALAGLQRNNHPNYIPLAKHFIAEFEGDGSTNLQPLKQRLNQAKSFTTGAEAPDFTQKNPEGEPVSLSDFRGKVLLVDFWASWCGPCRRENPNVVRLYEKYKDQGFEILGVSLDKSKDRWVQAINKDGLNWHHVSDLKGWGNAVAKQYGVRWIPHTVLLDREGKIIARRLRGEQLASKLESIFEE